MSHAELLEKVRALRAQRYTPAEIGRALGVSKADVARLVQVVAGERGDGAFADSTNGTSAPMRTRCWVSPGWRHGLRVDGHREWPDGGDAPSAARDSGVACVLVAVPDGRERLSVCGYLVDTWCLGVKNAIGPERMRLAEFESFRRYYFGPWESDGIRAPFELAQHLVLGAAEYAEGLGFEAHSDFGRARRLLGAWEGPSAITFGYDGKPRYLNGPHEDPQDVLATLERNVGRRGFDFTVSLGTVDGMDDGYQYTVTLVDGDELDSAA